MKSMLEIWGKKEGTMMRKDGAHLPSPFGHAKRDALAPALFATLGV